MFVCQSSLYIICDDISDVIYYYYTVYNIYSIYFWDKSPWNACIFIFSRIDVNSNKDQKKQQTIFPCLEENEVEKMARAHKSSCCSCSPPTSPSTYVYIFFVKLKFNFTIFFSLWRKTREIVVKLKLNFTKFLMTAEFLTYSYILFFQVRRKFRKKWRKWSWRACN